MNPTKYISRLNDLRPSVTVVEPSQPTVVQCVVWHYECPWYVFPVLKGIYRASRLFHNIGACLPYSSHFWALPRSQGKRSSHSLPEHSMHWTGTWRTQWTRSHCERWLSYHVHIGSHSLGRFGPIRWEIVVLESATVRSWRHPKLPDKSISDGGTRCLSKLLRPVDWSLGRKGV